MQNKIVLGLTLFLLIVGLTGCTELGAITNGQVTAEDKAELISYNIDSWTWTDEKISNGFNNNEQVDYYKIEGTIKSKLDRMTNMVVSLNFYDDENNYLGSEEIRLINVPSNEKHSFSKNINKHNQRFSSYFDQVEKVTFSFTEA